MSAKQSSQAPLYAALDLGTNSCRMLIARPAGKKFDVVDSFSKAVNLGESLESTGKLCRSSMDKALQALHVCRKKINALGVSEMRFVATEACRRASNSAEFIDRVYHETHLRLEIITAEEEARLALASCAPLVTPEAEQVLIVDIGGGSTELVWIDLSQVIPAERHGALASLYHDFHKKTACGARVVDWISVPLGVVTLRDLFGDIRGDAASFALMSCFFEEKLADFIPYSTPSQRSGFQVIGTSGTITTIAASHLGLRRYDRDLVDGLQMSSDQIDSVISEFLRLGPEGRRAHPNIGRDRQALIMSGAAILQTLLRLWPTDRLSVADRGLREGILSVMINKGCSEPLEFQR